MTIGTFQPLVLNIRGYFFFSIRLLKSAPKRQGRSPGALNCSLLRPLKQTVPYRMGYENRVASNSTIIRTTMNHSSKIEDSVQDKNLTQTILGFSYFRYYTFLLSDRTN